MRVLHIIPNTATGGAETMLLRILADDPRVAGDVAVLSLRSPGAVGEQMRAAGIRVFTLRIRNRLRTPFTALRMARVVNAFAPDIVHGWTLQGGIAGSMARTAIGRPVSLVWNLRKSLRSEAVAQPRRRQWLRLGAWLSDRPDAIVFNSRTAARQHAQAGFTVERSRLIANGFDPRSFRPCPTARGTLHDRFAIDPAALVVGHVASRAPMKDHATLIEAVARARGMGRDLHLLMVGQGMDAPGRALADKAARLLPPDRVTFAGLRNDVADWLPGIDMLAMSSAWGESFPHVLGEAMACGVPVVATDVGDSREIVGTAGRIVAPKDAIGFGQALYDIALMGAEARIEMGMAGRQRIIDHYSLDSIADSYADLHRQLYNDVRYLGRRADHPEALAQGLQP